MVAAVSSVAGRITAGSGPPHGHLRAKSHVRRQRFRHLTEAEGASWRTFASKVGASLSLRNFVLLAFSSLLMLPLWGCDDSARGPSPLGRSGGGDGVETLTCTAWERFAIPGTPHVLVNNQWNAQHAGSSPFEQCLLRRKDGETTTYGWSWEWPPFDPSTSFAAPEVVFGRKPWDGGLSPTPDLPRRISAINELWLDFAIDIAAEPAYNLNATMWLTRSDEGRAAKDPENIVAEVMVRFENPGEIPGCCVPDGSATLGGRTFEVFHLDAHGDDSGASALTWKMITYIATEQSRSLRFDLALVLRDLVSKRLVEDTSGVQGVELITEVSGGSGEAWLEEFDVQVK